MGSHLLMKRTLSTFFFVLTLTCILAFPVMADTGPSPKTAIEKMNAALLEAMKRADQLGYTGRYQLLEPVIKETLSLSFMGAQSVGRYWKTMTEQQRKTYMETYSNWTLATYAGRFDGYSGELFEVTSESPEVKGVVTVVSKLIQPKEAPIVFSYLMRQIDGKWSVVDIQVSGVSQLALTRAQFTEVLKNKGFDGLIAMLKEKTAGFSKQNK